MVVYQYRSSRVGFIFESVILFFFFFGFTTILFFWIYHNFILLYTVAYIYWSYQSVQSFSCVWLFATPWTAACQASLSIINSPEPTQTHVHRVGDGIQPSYPLSSPSPPAFSLSQHQGLFQCVGSSNQVAKFFEFQVQHQSFQWILKTDFL